MYSPTLAPSAVLTPRFERATASVAHAEMVKGLLLATAYFAMARIGYFTRLDGPLFAIGAAIAFPAWRPCLLLMVISVQDSPGQVVPYDYFGIAGVSAVMIFTAALNRSAPPPTQSMIEFRSLLKLGLLLVAYGMCSSVVQQKLGLHQQSIARPPLIIGCLMGMMMTTGYLAYRQLAADPLSSIRIRTVATCILVHIFFVAGMQVFFGPLFGSSPQGAEEMKQLFQMIDGGARGMARLTGPFLSPNILAAIPGLFMLMILRYQRETTISTWFIATFFVLGMLAAFLGGARTMFVFYPVGTAALTWTRSPKYTIVAGLLLTPLIFLMDIPWSSFLTIMRLKDLQSLGVRGQLWQATLQYMDFGDWVFGYGLTHYPVFVRSALGFYGSDPHNWILSAAGMFGVLGLVFYAVLTRKLIRCFLTADTKTRAIATCLFLFLIGREFANTQYILNNNPLCCLYWMVISLVFVDPPPTQEEASGQPAQPPALSGRG